MKTIKKIICMILCLIMSASLFTACNGNGDNEYPVEENATVVKFWVRSFEDYADALITKQVREFNSILDDGIQIDIKFYGDDNAYDTAIAAGMENDNCADLFVAQYDRLYTYLNAGYIAPMGDYLTESEKADFIDSAREEVTYIDPADGQEKMFAYPWRVDPSQMLFYRKDLLAQAGVSEDIKSWQDLYEACEALQDVMNPSLNQYALSIPTGAIELTWTTFGMLKNTTGGLAIDDSWMNSRLETHKDDFKKCAEFWFNIAKNGYAPLAQLTPEGYSDAVDALFEGKVAMCVDGSWGIARLYNYYPEMIDDIGVIEMPTYNGDTSGVTTCNGGWTYVLSGKTSEAKRQAAAEFIRWYLCDAQNAARYFEEAYYSVAPTTKSVRAYIEGNAKGVNEEWVALVNSVSEKAIMAPACEWAISEQIGQLFEYMINHANDGRSLDALFNEKYEDAINNVNARLNSDGYRGNPKYQND